VVICNANDDKYDAQLKTCVDEHDKVELYKAKIKNYEDGAKVYDDLVQITDKIAGTLDALGEAFDGDAEKYETLNSSCAAQIQAIAAQY
jgi:hypothetical protein